MKSFLPTDSSFEGHLHLFIQNLLLEKNCAVYECMFVFATAPVFLSFLFSFVTVLV